MYFFIKRFIDFFLSAFVLIVIMPFLVLVALILFFANNGSPFFIQLRPGKNSKIFKIYKFKTMNDKMDDKGILLPDDIRLTKFGLLIRKASIDELLQLFNVIKGEMSLVGPRPLLVEYLPLYNDKQKRRHEVKPGITGWAQINGRNAINWKERFELDVWYVDNVSFLLDLKIMISTIGKVFNKTGISSKTNITMEKFIGN